MPESAARPRPRSWPPARSIPARTELQIAQELRQRSHTASPNRRIVSIADDLLGRNGRMVDAIEAIGPGAAATEAIPFRLELE